MAAISTYLANKLLDPVLKNVAYSPPASVYLALYTSNPDDDNSGSEVTGGDYARIQTTFAVASGKATANSAILTSATATDAWGTITHFGIMDALTNGNLLFYGEFDTAKAIASTNAAYINAGEIDIELL
jgi:hypothetical protein